MSFRTTYSLPSFSSPFFFLPYFHSSTRINKILQFFLSMSLILGFDFIFANFGLDVGNWPRVKLWRQWETVKWQEESCLPLAGNWGEIIIASLNKSGGSSLDRGAGGASPGERVQENLWIWNTLSNSSLPISPHSNSWGSILSLNFHIENRHWQLWIQLIHWSNPENQILSLVFYVILQILLIINSIP